MDPDKVTIIQEWPVLKTKRNIWCIIKVQLFTSPVPPGPPHQIMKGNMSHEPIIHVTIIKLTVSSKLSLSYNTCYIKYLYLFKPFVLRMGAPNVAIGDFCFKTREG